MRACEDATGGSNDLNMPTIQGAVLIDNVGWLVGDLIKMFEAEKAKGRNRVPPFEVIDNANWEGLKISTSLSPIISKVNKRKGKETKLFAMSGLEGNAMIAHHRPSGKLILSSSKEFAVNLFSKKPKLSTDPVFLAKTKGLPKQGTAISYLSPVLMSEIRKFIKEVYEAGNPPEDDLFVALSIIDFFFRKVHLVMRWSDRRYFYPLEILLILINQKMKQVFFYEQTRAYHKSIQHWCHHLMGSRIDGNTQFLIAEQTINGHHFEVRDGNVKYNGQEIETLGSNIKKLKFMSMTSLYKKSGSMNNYSPS